MKLLLKNLDLIVTCDDQRRELRGADVLVDGPVIAAVGGEVAAGDADRIIDGRGLVALPGLVNAHQHLYQGALRSLPDLERASMGPWLAGIGRRCLQWWRDGVYTPEMVGRVTKAVLLESLLGGTTTVADQYYFYPGGVVAPYLEATIEAAREVGVRIHAGRGSITLGESGGGTAADILVETIDGVIGHSQSLIEEYHDAAPFASVRIALAPCGLHVDKPELFDATAQLAAEHPQVRLHTHLYEKVDAAVCAQTYGTTPWRMLQSHGWAGERTWLAHVNDPPPGEIPEMAAAGVGVTHLIAPDLRLGWGLAPVRAYLDQEMTVGFGTTGSASNDGANMLADLRLAALAHRPAAQDPAQWISARELIRMATAGSAACIGRDDLGSIAAGYAADIACWDMNTVDRVGVHDPVAGLVLTGLSQRANLVIVGGRVLVEGGVPMLADEAAVARSARDAIPM